MRTNYILIFFILIFISCKKDLNSSEGNNTEKKTINEFVDVTIIKFPDTIRKNTIGKGIIDYNFEEYNEFKDKIGSGKISRYLYFFPYITDKKIANYNDFVIKDTVYTQDVKRIFFDLKFDSVGSYYINGLIKDIVVFDTIKRENIINNKLPAKISHVLINKRVVVIE